MTEHGILGMALLVISGLFCNPQANAATPITGVERQAIEKIVHEYILENPEILIEASQILQEREDSSRQDQILVAMKENADQIFFDPDSPVTGTLTGDVTIVEFFDYR